MQYSNAHSYLINLSLCFVHTIKVLDEITEENNSFQKDITRLRPILDNVQKVDIMLKSGELMSTVQLNQGTIELDQDDDEEERLVIPIFSCEVPLDDLRFSQVIMSGESVGDFTGFNIGEYCPFTARIDENVNAHKRSK